MNMNSFGAMLKQARKQASLTQEQLAEKMDVTVMSVQNWESGKTKVREAKLKKLSYICNISLETLFREWVLSDRSDMNDNFPYFLFDENTNQIIKTLHLSPSQQELFGIFYIYHADYLDKIEMDSSTLRDDLKRIPYEFINRFGIIQTLNIAEGLYHVLKYVQTDFLLKVLKLNPETEFNICCLSKELICDFIDSGYKKIDEGDWDADYDHSLWFHINMHKAKKILPLLEKSDIHLTDDLKSNSLRVDVPEEI